MQGIALSVDHWTVRWYRYYVGLGGFGRDPENLCRFLRVITIWAPLRWLFYGKEKERFPRILIIVAIMGFLLFVSTIVFATCIQIEHTYNAQGMAGFVPSRADARVTGYVLGSAALLVAVVLAWSGLLKLYKERYRYARNGKLCPFMSIQEGSLMLPAAPQETEKDEQGEDDPLLVAAKAILAEVQENNGQVSFYGYDRLKAAVAEEDADE